jgi:hypothetical protein
VRDALGTMGYYTQGQALVAPHLTVVTNTSA